jgi:hypothetical protein
VQTVVRCSAMSDACIGPINAATDLPDETCGAEATKILFFPHQGGVAFMSSCDRHVESLARWAGIRFGNCFAGGPIAKGARTMTEAAAQFGPITMPHGDDFDALLGVPVTAKRSRGPRRSR